DLDNVRRSIVYSLNFSRPRLYQPARKCGEGAMTDMPAAGLGRAPGRAEPGPIHRDELMATLNRAAQKRVTIISSPAGTGKTSLLRAWADQPGQDGRIAFMTVRPSQHDMQLFWLTILDAVRAAAGAPQRRGAAACRRAHTM